MGTTIQEKVLTFVKQHDLNPSNSKAETIPANQVTSELANSFNQTVLRALSPTEAAEFHQANEILFEYIPPDKRTQFLSWIQQSCQPNSSVICHASEIPPPSTPPKQNCSALSFEEFGQCEVDKSGYEANTQIQDLNKIPAITNSQFPEIYKKISWYIEKAREAGEIELANGLEKSLIEGKLKYLPDLKVAQAYADPRVPGTIIFGKDFFERTWGDDIQGLDGSPIQVTDEEVLKKANLGLMQSYNNIAELTVAAAIIPTLKPETIRAKLIEEKTKSQKERFKYYYGTFPISTFDSKMPAWIILLGHEFRHTMQMNQDQTDWHPAWTRGIAVRRIAYYTTLVRYNSAIKLNQPAHGLHNGISGKLSKEAEVNKRMVAIASVREEEATTFAVHVGQKLKKYWRTAP